MNTIFADMNRIKEAINDAIADALPGFIASEVYVLRALYSKDNQRPTDLADAIGKARTGFTAVLDKLEQKGLIERSATKSDRRVVLIRLTDAGRIKKALVMNAFLDAEQAARVARDGADIPF